jgi:hypothetical protein
MPVRHSELNDRRTASPPAGAWPRVKRRRCRCGEPATRCVQLPSNALTLHKQMRLPSIKLCRCAWHQHARSTSSAMYLPSPSSELSEYGMDRKVMVAPLALPCWPRPASRGVARRWPAARGPRRALLSVGRTPRSPGHTARIGDGYARVDSVVPQQDCSLTQGPSSHKSSSYLCAAVGKPVALSAYRVGTVLGLPALHLTAWEGRKALTLPSYSP